MRKSANMRDFVTYHMGEQSSDEPVHMYNLARTFMDDEDSDKN